MTAETGFKLWADLKKSAAEAASNVQPLWIDGADKVLPNAPPKPSVAAIRIDDLSKAVADKLCPPRYHNAKSGPACAISPAATPAAR